MKTTTRLIGTAAAFALALAVAAPASVRAASVTFGTPTAKITFGKTIVFSEPISGDTFAAADLVVQTPGDLLPNAYAVDQPGTSSLTYTMDNSSTPPFEPIDAHFEVIFADGTIQQGPSVHVVNRDDRFTWNSKTSGLVTLYWLQGSDAFASQLLSYATTGLAKSAAFFGITETRHIDFYIYPSSAVFQQGLNVPDTIGGQARPEYRTCFAEVGTSDMTYGSQVVPHELTHVAFADAVDNAFVSEPNWLNEGLAVYLSQGFDSSDRSLVKQAASSGKLVPLASLKAYFFLDSNRIYQSYAEAVSAVDFMIRKYGEAGIQKLIKAYHAGSTDDEAFQTALGVTPDAFDKAWMADNGVALPNAYGPQAAPTGALPPGWTSGGTGASGSQPPSSVTSAPTPSASGGSAASTGGTVNDPTSTVMLVSAVIAGLGVLLLLVGAMLVRRDRGRPVA